MTVTQPRAGLGRAAMQGTVWLYAAFFSGKLLIFISTTILARLLTKDDFGVVGYAVTVIGFLDVLSDLGLGPAVIFHKDEPGVADLAFWLGLLISSGLCLLAWAVAPWIGLFFNDPRAIPVTRALAFTFPLSALGNIHENVLRKRLLFRRTFVADFFQALAKGSISVLCALAGLGQWSLIIGQLSGTLLAVIVLWIINPWRPKWIFEAQLARSLLQYGMSIVGVDALGILLLNADYLFVGRYLGATALGVYTLAFRLPDLAILQFSRILSTVIFPVFTHMREKPGALGRGFVRTMRYVALITTPLGLGLALLADPFVNLVFSSKWAEAVSVTQAIALYALISGLSYNAGSAYKAEGRPQVLTYIGLARTVVLIPGLWWAVTYPRTILAVGWVQVAVATVGLVLNLVVAVRLLETPMRDFLTALRPAALAGGLMALALAGALRLMDGAPNWEKLVVGTALGALVYLASAALLERGLVGEVTQIARSLLKRG